MLLGWNQRFIFQSVGDDVAAHQLPPFVVKVVEEGAKVLQGQQRQDVVVGVHWDLHQPHQLLGHHASMLQAATPHTSISAVHPQMLRMLGTKDIINAVHLVCHPRMLGTKYISSTVHPICHPWMLGTKYIINAVHPVSHPQMLGSKYISSTVHPICHPQMLRVLGAKYIISAEVMDMAEYYT